MKLVLIPLIAALGAAAYAADDTPSWLRELAAAKAPSYASSVPAVVLLDETQVTVDDSGRVLTRNRQAIRILNREGRASAQGAHVYSSGTAKIRDLRAWMIGPSGDPLPIDKTSYFDRALIDNNAYDDLRIRGVNASGRADAGSVFGYESVAEETLPFMQFDWSFQQRLPELVSRRTLTLPAGWKARAIPYNQGPAEPVVDGATYTWELRNLPFIEVEPASPNLAAIVPRVCVSFSPAAGQPLLKPLVSRSFANWREVSEWVSTISDPAAEPDTAITGKALTLTANAGSEFQRIQLIGRWVQSLRYVSIQTGTGRGGGYKPRTAADTFLKEYGDCKDKATLTRALLKAIGIPSFLVAINGSDRTYVRQEWASPQQFDHAIVAIVVKPETQAAALLAHPQLGRLLFFDPTDASTPAGDLPWVEQGAYGLIAAGAKGELLRLPVTQPGHNVFERDVRASLTAEGLLTAVVREEAQGQAASADRVTFYGQPRAEYNKIVERFVARGATGALVSKVAPQDSFLASRFSMDVEFQAPNYAQLKANRLLIFKPAVVGRRDAVFLTQASRTQPISLSPTAWKETAHFKLPAGFQVDELPDPEKLEAPFGIYAASCEVKDGELTCTRQLEIRSSLIPVQQYSAVREFYQRIAAAEQSPVVLVKK